MTSKFYFLLIVGALALLGAISCGDSSTNPETDADGDVDGDVDGDGDSDGDTDGDTDADADGDTDADADGDADGDPPPVCGEATEKDCDLICDTCASLITSADATPETCRVVCAGLDRERGACLTACAAEDRCADAEGCLTRATSDGCEQFCSWANGRCDPSVWETIPQEDCPGSCSLMSEASQSCLVAMTEEQGCSPFTVVGCVLGGEGREGCGELCAWASGSVEGCGITWVDYGAIACQTACDSRLMLVFNPNCPFNALEARDCDALRRCGGIFLDI